MTRDAFKRLQKVQNFGEPWSKRSGRHRYCPCCVGPINAPRKRSRKKARVWLKRQDQVQFKEYL